MEEALAQMEGSTLADMFDFLSKELIRLQVRNNTIIRTISVISYSEKNYRVLPTEVEPMTFHTPFGRSTTELQETRGS